MNFNNNWISSSLTASWTPEPTITLKRGKVELSIKNASSIVKKMDELFPKKSSYYTWEKTPAEIESHKHDKNVLVTAAKNWFKQEFYGTNEDDFDIVISNESPKQLPVVEESEKLPPIPYSDYITPIEMKSVNKNKNAYEIRDSMIEKAMSIVVISSTKETCDVDTMTDKILRVASKLYEFVENKNRNKH